MTTLISVVGFGLVLPQQALSKYSLKLFSVQMDFNYTVVSDTLCILRIKLSIAYDLLCAEEQLGSHQMVLISVWLVYFVEFSQREMVVVLSLPQIANLVSNINVPVVVRGAEKERERNKKTKNWGICAWLWYYCATLNRE